MKQSFLVDLNIWVALAAFYVGFVLGDMMTLTLADYPHEAVGRL